jgi:hypothetical protein
MSDAPLFLSPLYGLRTWTVTGEGGSERLAAPHQGQLWPADGEWLHASCARSGDHAAPAPGCSCGIHAWHPSLAAARQVLAIRRQLPGVVAAEGTVELHADGFRAQRARPYAFVLQPGGNAALVHRLAARHGAAVVPVRGPQDLLEWCRERELGLPEPVVTELLGPAPVAEARRSRTRADALRLALAVGIAGLLVALGISLQNDPPGDRVLHGRTGEIHVGADGDR